MKQISDPGEFQRLCQVYRSQGLSIGLVPTMGALHSGHGELIKAARKRSDVVALSIFVNPLQFDNPDDLVNYPVTLQADLEFASSLGVDLVFLPSRDQMHPEPVMIRVEVGKIAEVLEGKSRPGHFSGVATVVAKLFILAGECEAYFGEKDFQQLAIISRMVEEMHFPVEIIGVPIVRDSDGLALSSRNLRLSKDQKKAALALSRALFAAKAAISDGLREVSSVESVMVMELKKPIAGVSKSDYPVLDYALVVDQATLTRPDRIDRPVRLVIAAWVGDVRLIDNLGIDVSH